MKKPGTSVSQFANVTDNNMASKKELVVIAAMLLLEEDDEEVKEKKRIWSRHAILERKNKGSFGQLLPDLAAHDTPGFEKFMRMDFDHFKKIVDNLSETLYKKDTIMRESIKPAEMCCLTLRYLAALQHAVRTEANFIGYLKIAHAFPAQTMPG
jgi:hypothetical protein